MYIMAKTCNLVDVMALILSIIIVYLIDYSVTQDPICGMERFSHASCSPNHSLTGASNLLSRETPSKRKCFTLCLRTTGCKSVNFNIGTRECELLGSKQNELPAENLIQTTGVFYCEIATKVVLQVC